MAPLGVLQTCRLASNSSESEQGSPNLIDGSWRLRPKIRIGSSKDALHPLPVHAPWGLCDDAGRFRVLVANGDIHNRQVRARDHELPARQGWACFDGNQRQQGRHHDTRWEPVRSHLRQRTSRGVAFDTV